MSYINPRFIQPTIAWVPSRFSGCIWLDTKFVLKIMKWPRPSPILSTFTLWSLRLERSLGWISYCISNTSFFKHTFVSSHMYPDVATQDPSNCRLNEHGIYISDTARDRTQDLFRPKREPIPLGQSDGRQVLIDLGLVWVVSLIDWSEIMDRTPRTQQNSWEFPAEWWSVWPHCMAFREFSLMAAWIKL